MFFASLTGPKIAADLFLGQGWRRRFLVGLRGSLLPQISEVTGELRAISARFEGVEGRIDGLEGKIDGEFKAVHSEIRRLDRKIDSVDKRLDVAQRLAVVEGKVHELEARK